MLMLRMLLALSLAGLPLELAADRSKRPGQGQTRAPGFFEGSEVALDARAAGALRALRARKARLNPAWVERARRSPNHFGLFSVHHIAVFSDATVSFVVTDASRGTAEGWVIQGKVLDQADSTVILAFAGGRLNGSILVPGGPSYQIASGPDGLHTLLLLDPNKQRQCDVP